MYNKDNEKRYFQGDMTEKIIFVAIGGAAGAVCRYLLGLINVRIDFPVITLTINLIGAIAIGFITALVAGKNISENINLLLKTGFCGGFTTFSTFSLETLTLLECGRTLAGVVYSMLSLVLCVAGVWLGQYAAHSLS